MDYNELLKAINQPVINLPFINQKIEGIIKDIKEIYSFWNITIASEELIQKESGSYKYELSFKLANFLENKIFITRVAYYIRNCPYKFTFETFLVNSDLTPVCIKSPNTRFLTMRHLLKINALLRFGSFSIDNIGVIKFYLLWNYETNAHLAMKSKEDIQKWMKISLVTTISTLKVNMTKLLMMTELIDPETYNSIVSVHGSTIRQIPKFFNDDQEKLRNITIEGIRKKISGDQTPVKVYDPPRCLNPFYQKVKVKKFNYHGRLSFGSFGSMHVVRVLMEVEEEGKTIIKDKYLFAKVPPQPPGTNKDDKEYVMQIVEGLHKKEDSRIKNERKVLSHPKDKHFGCIARHYDDENNQSQIPLLFIENYMSTNLHELNRKMDLSMSTKLAWLYQLAHVLHFFEKNDIVHTKLTTENILVTNKLFLKVMDFSDSIIKNDKDLKNEERRAVLPFSSPESLSDNIDDIGFESDVFSFAHIAYELFCGKSMVGIKKSSEKKLTEKYKKKDFKFLPISEWLNFQGPKYLMQYMYHIIELCGASDPSCRLPQDVLINLIQHYAIFTEKLF